MANLPDLNVKITADTASLKRGLSQAQANISKLRSGVNAGAKSLAKFGTAATLAGGALGIHLVKKSLDAVDAQAKLAKQLDTTVSSMATLERAGGLAGVSMGQIGVAGRTLALRLGEAKQGTGGAADALKQLKLNADDLASVPLDQRIIMINKALVENVDKTERAAVASELFGSRAATAIMQLDNDTLATAARQAELFGTALSDIDASKVESANDSMSTIGLAIQGATNQLAVKLSPILMKVTDQFEESVEEAGGLGNAVGDGVNTGIKAFGFLLDAIDGVKRVFNILANTIIVGFGAITLKIQDDLTDVFKMLNAIPGVDMTKSIANMEAFAGTTRSVITQAIAEIKAIANAPFPSESLKAWVAEAEAEALKVATAIAAAKEGKTKDGEPAFTSEDLDALGGFDEDQQSDIDRAQAANDEIFNSGKDANKKKIDDTRKTLGSLAVLAEVGGKKSFGISKKFALAEATISMYQGVAAGVAKGYPAAIPLVAAALATGASAISSIQSTSHGGGGGGGGSVATPSAAPAAPEATQNLHVQGVDPGQMFSGQQLVDIINMAQESGAQLRIGGA